MTRTHLDRPAGVIPVASAGPATSPDPTPQGGVAASGLPDLLPLEAGRPGAPKTPASLAHAPTGDAGQAPAGGANADGKLRPPAGFQRTFTIELPAGLAVLNLNKRLHWARERAIAKELRLAAWAMARQQRIPHLYRARIVVEYQPPRTSRRRDAENIPAPSGKHAVDGLVDAKVLTDDECPRYVEKIEHLIGKPHPRGRLVLHVTEVDA
jgi:crossover junction endodeoxyribonuclease RusA